MGRPLIRCGRKKFAKSALWQITSRTPLIIQTHDGHQGRCSRPVSLVDLYPTLVDLCGLPPNTSLDGRSLAPLVKRPNANWPYPAIITHPPHWHRTNHAIRSERFDYICYDDGGEELYDMKNDPNQWRNLAQHQLYDSEKTQLRKWLPTNDAPHFRSKKN